MDEQILKIHIEMNDDTGFNGDAEFRAKKLRSAFRTIALEIQIEKNRGTVVDTSGNQIGIWEIQ